jgi:hypothetical protein
MADAKRPRRPRVTRAGAAATAARGEHTLSLGGASYVLRPSYAATAAIEDELGQSALELLRRANAGALGYADLGSICAEYIRAGAPETDRLARGVAADRIAELIFEEGITSVLIAVTLVLADAISGGRTASGEAKAVTNSPAESVTAG